MLGLVDTPSIRTFPSVSPEYSKAAFLWVIEMNALTEMGATLTMSSREIAELTEKAHKHVLRDARKMLAEIHSAENWAQYQDASGRTLPMLLLDKEETLCLVAGYNAALRMKIIRRLKELEAQQKPVLPQSFAEALRLAADQQEQIEQQAAALAIAAPKVEFVDRYVEASGLKGFRQVAKLLRANEARFREFLADQRIMYRLGGEWVPYQQHIDAGRFEVKTGSSDGGHAFNQAKFTPKGVNWIANLWQAQK